MRTLSRPDRTTNLTVGLIPARWSSTRFEGKPLALINGIPMIRRVYDLACQVEQLDTVVVLTDADALVNTLSFPPVGVIISKVGVTALNKIFSEDNTLFPPANSSVVNDTWGRFAVSAFLATP